MQLRPVIAILAGGLVWAFMFPLLVVLMTFVWPSLDEAVQVYRKTQQFDVFGSTSMLIVFQLLWALTNGTAGLVTAVISKRRIEVLILMVILVAWFGYNHLWAEWDEFPVWYNLLVVALVAPMAIVGGMIPELVRGPRKSGESSAVS
jgi:hypothetical protein